MRDLSAVIGLGLLVAVALAVVMLAGFLADEKPEPIPVEALSNSAETELVDIAPDLEGILCDKLNLPTGDLTPEHLLGVVELVAIARDVSSIMGLQYCRNLRQIELQYNAIEDISPLEALPELEYVNLAGNNVSDIRVLCSLPSLRQVVLEGNLASASWVETLDYLRGRNVAIDID